MHKLTCALAVMFLAAMAPMAHAGLEIIYTGDIAGNCGPVANPNPSVVCPNIVGPPFNVTILGASSNAPGDTPSEETSATVTLTNTDTVSHSIVINAISTGFTTPGAPPAR